MSAAPAASRLPFAYMPRSVVLCRIQMLDMVRYLVVWNPM